MTAALVPIAHGVGAGRADLPISRELFIVSALVVLAVSFVGLAVLWGRPKLERPRVRELPRGLSAVLVSRPLEILCGAIGVFLLFLTVWAGLTGVQSELANFAPTFVFVVFWVGLLPVSMLFGDVFRAFNPWRAIGRAVAWVAQTAARGPLPAPLEYPERLGRYPATLGIFAFVTLELVYSNRLPDTVAISTLIYSAITFVGMALYGVDKWCDRGEAFGVYFNLFARMSVFERRERSVVLRPPLSGLTQLVLLPGTVALLAVMIGSVSFDGIRESTFWTGVQPDLVSFFEGLGLSPQRAFESGYFVGLVGFILVIFGFYRLGILGVSLVGGDKSPGSLARSFVHSLVPIAMAYAAAHYLSLLVFQGQAVVYLASNPLGEDGTDIFGTASRAIDYGAIDFDFTSYAQVAFVVLGHVAGLTLAHDRALVVYDKPKLAVLSQYWMFVVMVGFTILALLLLLQSNA